MTLKKIILIIFGIPLFIWGIRSALDAFESRMNFIDWLVMKLAPSLPPQLGDLVRVLAIILLIFFVIALPKAIEELAQNYL